MELGVNEAKVQCLIDTGAQCTLLKEETLADIVKQGTLSLREKYMKVTGLNGQPVRTTEALQAMITLGDGYRFKMDLAIMPDKCASFPGDCLLGMDVLRAFNYKLVGYTYPVVKQYLVLDGHKTRVYYPDELNPDGSLPLETSNQAIVTLGEDTVWLPRTGRWVEAQWEGCPTGELLLVTSADGGVNVPPAVYSASKRERKMTIWTVNELEEVCHLKRGSPIAITEDLIQVLADTEVQNEADVLELPRYCMDDEWDGPGVAPNSAWAYQPTSAQSGPQVASALPAEILEEEKVAVPPDESSPSAEDISAPHLSQSQAEAIEQLVVKFRELFDEDAPLGRVPGITHQIRTEPDVMPIRTRQWRMPEASKAIIRQECNDMLNRGVVEPSASPWLSPVVLVKKKDGKVRFCIDYRQLNSRTIMDAFPMPRVDELIDDLSGALWFSTLDAKNAYWTVEMDPADKAKTAFSDGHRLLQFTRMPFGLVTAPSTFQRTMNYVLTTVLGRHTLAYMDDVVVFSGTFDEHIRHLTETLGLLERAGFRLNRSKCTLAAKEIKFLGFRVSQGGVRPEPEKTAAIAKMERPSNVKAVRRFLGCTGFFRRHVPGYAGIAKPLTLLTRKEKPFIWGEEQEVAWQTLKDKLVAAPILRLPDFTKEFEVHCDASGTAVGACLMQKGDDGVLHALNYFSRKLHGAEESYSAIDTEALAVVEAVRQFDAYLYGRHFIIYTDHRPLTYVFNRRCTSLRMSRWWHELTIYSYTLRYKKGATNHVPDLLSRDVNVLEVLPQMDSDELACDKVAAAQQADPVWAEVKAYLEGKAGPPPRSTMARSNKDLSDFDLKDGCIHFFKQLEGKTIAQLLIPAALQREAVRRAHDAPTAGHLGVDKTLHRLRQLYYFPGMWKVVQEYVKSCLPCQQQKGQAQVSTSLSHQPDPTEPFERVSMDMMSVNAMGTNFKYILTFVDHYTRYVILVPMKTKKQETVAEVIIERLIAPFGPPKTMQMDHGSEFNNKSLHEVCDSIRSKMQYTIIRRPQGNGIIERTHRVIRSMLKTLIEERQRWRWYCYVPLVQLAMNTAIHRTTGEQPLYLLTGRGMYFPTGDTNVEVARPAQAVLLPCHRRIQYVRSLAQEKMRAAREAWIAYYNEHIFRAAEKEFQTGDLVMRLQRLGAQEGRGGAFQPKWDGPYRILGPHGRSGITWDIKELVGQREAIVHTNDLKKYHPPPDEEIAWPEEDDPLPRDEVESDVEEEPDQSPSEEEKEVDDPESAEGPESLQEEEEVEEAGDVEDEGGAGPSHRPGAEATVRANATGPPDAVTDANATEPPEGQPRRKARKRGSRKNWRLGKYKRATTTEAGTPAPKRNYPESGSGKDRVLRGRATAQTEYRELE